MKFISYYTENTPYESVMETYLKPSLIKFGLEYVIEKIPNKGSWKSNTDYKPVFIKEQLLKYDSVVWLDADAEIVQHPELFFGIEPNFTLALHELDWNLHYNNGTNKIEILTGTMFLRKECLWFLDEWAYLTKQFKWEQQALEKIVREYHIPFFKLPSEYCAIVNREYKVPSYIQNPVIIHHQASRKLRRII